VAPKIWIMRYNSKVCAQLSCIGFFISSIFYVYSVKKVHHYVSNDIEISRKLDTNDQEYFECPNWPRLFILGAQKAGTTSVFRALMEHPNFCFAVTDKLEPMSYEKEVHYFDLNGRFKKDPSFYCSRFSKCVPCSSYEPDCDPARDERLTEEGMLHVDSTPAYLDFSIAERMGKTFSPSARKNMKFIAILREPVGRMVSWYNHLRSITPENEYRNCYKYCARLFRETFKENLPTNSGIRPGTITIAQGDDLEKFLSFEEFALTEEVTTRKGKYIDILEEYFNVFGAENVLVLNFDSLMKFQRKTMTLISEFLGVDDAWDSNFTFPHFNEFEFDGKISIDDVDSAFLREMVDFYQPYNKRLYTFLRINRDKLWHGQPSFPPFTNILKED